MSKLRLIKSPPLIVAWTLLSLCNANAEIVASGKWRCADDNADSVKIERPSEQIAEDSESFAEGSAEAILGKGAPTDVFLWATLHVIQRDRTGSSTYRVTALVRDVNGWYYMATPRLETTVEGVSNKTERHRYAYGVFRVPAGDDAEALKKAIDMGVDLIVEIHGERGNKGYFGDVPMENQKIIQKYLAGQIEADELLKSLNKRKSPQQPKQGTS